MRLRRAKIWCLAILAVTILQFILVSCDTAAPPQQFVGTWENVFEDTEKIIVTLKIDTFTITTRSYKEDGTYVDSVQFAKAVNGRLNVDREEGHFIFAINEAGFLSIQDRDGKEITRYKRLR
ncbi:MAG TPA: hypothetical protein VGB30_13785 [bacterium]|jgi:hypothetical protein